jgi:hypothetical protein
VKEVDDTCDNRGTNGIRVFACMQEGIIFSLILVPKAFGTPGLLPTPHIPPCQGGMKGGVSDYRQKKPLKDNSLLLYEESHNNLHIFAVIPAKPAPEVLSRGAGIQFNWEWLPD